MTTTTTTTTMKFKLDSTSAFRLQHQVQTNMVKHQLAFRFLSHRQFWGFTVPQASLTMLSSILAFLATSKLFGFDEELDDFTSADNEIITTRELLDGDDDDDKITIREILSITVGVMTAMAVFLQTVSGVCDFVTRAAMHHATAIDLRDLRDDLVILVEKLGGFEKKRDAIKEIIAQLGKSPNNAETKASDPKDNNETDIEKEDLGDVFLSIQTRFQESLSGCKSMIPLKIDDAFRGLDSNLKFAATVKNTKYLYRKNGSVDFDDHIASKAYDILSSEIIGNLLFPFLFPNSKKVVEKTMKRLQSQIEEYDTFWIREVNTKEIKKFFEDLEEDGDALRYASDELKDNKKIVLAVVEKKGKALQLQHASDELKDTEDIVLAAVKQDGNALKFASKEVKGDRKVVLAAVTQNGNALQFASKEVIGDKYIVLAAVKNNSSALEHASDELKVDKDVLAAVNKNDEDTKSAASAQEGQS